MWLGKILGGIFGFLVFGPIGAVLGVLLGHWFDKNQTSFSGQNAKIREAYFQALFTTMGHLAKLDGRVTESEIHVARQIMQHMRLNAAQQKAAIGLFNTGKQPGYDVQPMLTRLLHTCRNRRNLLRMFMQLLLQAAYADGQLAQAEQQFLHEVAKSLGFSTREFQQMHAMYQAQFQFRQRWQSSGRGGQQQSHQYQRMDSRRDLQQAYAVLGVSENASSEDVKKAYRRLMNQYHPDKLVAKGLPEEMMKAANEKTQQIKEAYEMIKRSQSGK